MASRPDAHLPKLEARTIAGGDAWSVMEFTCRAGPGDRAFEEAHGAFSVAAVVSGTFMYRSGTGQHLLHPGALLLGNHGACYECGHDHGRGDRCISFQVAPELFREIAASAGGASTFRFPTAMIPAGSEIGPSLVATLASCEDGLQSEEAAFDLVETVIAHLRDRPPRRQHVSARDAQRISRALRHIEEHAAEPIELGELAERAGTTKYHFIRIFRSAVGTTPYQFLLETRLRTVAANLLGSAVPITTAALEAGFGDISTFNARFRARFGLSPSAYRRRYGRSS
ncbi:MAG: helix-turn-helix domain-containing protein [Hyphomicrobiales bacterium]|nr:MAG: helix-turn-helix domain-containing protein [Hyphomicrobiales bacterium]